MNGAPHTNEVIQSSLRARIDAAFPDLYYSGAVTPVDARLNQQIEELDEERALFNALKNKKWSDIPESIVLEHPNGHSLLTEDAFAAFIPAWLCVALANGEVRELMIYFLSASGGAKGRLGRVPNWALTHISNRGFQRILEFLLGRRSVTIRPRSDTGRCSDHRRSSQ